MPTINVRMPSPTGVAAGQTATFRLPIGRRYHELQMFYGGSTFDPDYMDEIRVIVNGKVIQRFSGADRDAWNQFDGLAAAAGILVIPFERVGLYTLAAEEATCINTGSINPETGAQITSFSVEVDISSSAVAPTLSMYATQSDAVPGGPGTVLHIKALSYNPTAAGEYQIADLPRDSAETLAINRIWFKPSANDISTITIERNNYVVLERTKAANALFQTNGVRTPQSGYIAIDRTETGRGGDPIDLVGLNDFRLRLDVTGAMTLATSVEYLGRLGD